MPAIRSSKVIDPIGHASTTIPPAMDSADDRADQSLPSGPADSNNARTPSNIQLMPIRIDVNSSKTPAERSA